MVESLDTPFHILSHNETSHFTTSELSLHENSNLHESLQDHIEACMKVHMKVSMNIKSTVKFGNFTKLAVKFALNFTAEVAKRQCSKQLH